MQNVGFLALFFRNQLKIKTKTAMLKNNKSGAKSAKVAGKTKTISWNPKLVDVKLIKPTTNNYKIKTDLGKQRLQASLGSFGLAGTVIVNTDFMLIDGNSRLEEAKEKGEKKIWVSLPDRKLSPKEFQEMSAMYDYAKAGEVDIDRIKGELGTTEDFYKKYGMAVPLALLEKLGAKAELSKLDYPEEGKGSSSDMPVSDIVMVQLFFSAKQESEFRKIEEKLKVKYKTTNVTDTVLRAFKELSKGK
jgi:hypothetical protein